MEKEQLRLVIDQVINFWHANNKTVTDFYQKHEDEVYQQEVAPGRNTGVYLLGHLIASNDGLMPLFGFGSKLFPELEDFASKAQDTITIDVTVPELRIKWNTLNEVLTSNFIAMSNEDWLGRHNSVSEEDFKLDPKRNKLNVLMNRAGHQNYHRGQLIFLNERAVVA